MISQNYLLILLLIFILGILIRFLYFPNNIYFSYDQARDSFVSQEIFQGHLKIIGPPSSFNEQFFHGPLIYYIYAPIYFLSQQNPVPVAIFLRLFNALGIIITFIIATIIFDKKTGLLSALLFAVSFEQSQYSLFLSHPGLAVTTVLLFYLGLALLIFQQNQKGLILALVGLSLSIQLHYINVLSFLALFFYLILFFPYFKILQAKYIFTSVLSFLFIISTFVLAELKYQFRISQGLIAFLQNPSLNNFPLLNHLNRSLLVLNRSFQDNLLASPKLFIGELIFLLVCLWLMFNKKNLKPKILFLLLWFLGGLIPYFLIDSPSYYYNAGASVSLLIISSYFISRVLLKVPLIAIVFIMIIFLTNIYQITKQNFQGPNSDFVIQKGMLLTDEEKIIDYIYTQADNKPFAIQALTVPLSINTTWSYLFEWYGQEKYHYLPTYIGPTAQGYPGKLFIEDARSKLPQKQFLIIEPTAGIRPEYINQFFIQEGYFSKITEEKKFGMLTVQKRQPY